MKRLLYIATGGLLVAVLAFLVGSVATNWYSEHLAKSDDDINSVVKVFLVLWPLLIAAGAALGNAVYRRSLTLPSSGPPPAGRERQP